MRSGRRPVPEGGRSLPAALTTTPLKTPRKTRHLRGADHQRLLIRIKLDGKDDP